MNVKNTISKVKDLSVVVYYYPISKTCDNYGMHENQVNNNINHYTVGVWRRKKY